MILQNLKIPLIILLSLSAFLILLFTLSGKKPFGTLLLNLFMGIVLLAIINLTSVYTGIYIPVNKYTVVGSGVFGVPSIIGLLLLNIIFM